MPGKAATMVIFCFLSLGAMAYALTLNNWYISIEEDEDEDIIQNGILYFESIRERDDGEIDIDSVRISSFASQASDYCEKAEDTERSEESREFYEDACEYYTEMVEVNALTSYGVLAGIGIGLIGIFLGVYTTKGLSPIFPAVLITLCGLLFIASAVYFQQNNPSFLSITEDEMIEEFGLGLWITFAAGGMAIIASIFGYISNTKEHYY